MVENIQPVIGKIIELIILLSQIDVIRIRLRAPFENKSEEGYTNQGSVIVVKFDFVSLPLSSCIRIQQVKFRFSFGMNLRVRSSSVSQLYLSVP